VKIPFVLFFCCLVSECLWAGEFSTVVRGINTKLVADNYVLNADIDYKLSPVAKQALQKGISITWVVAIKVEEKGALWNSTLQELAFSYQIQNHALLNLYSVKSLKSGEKEMISTLTGALDFISKIRDVPIIDRQLVRPEQRYHVAVKVSFQHEALPVPMRPFSYFDSQWTLSSRWVLADFP